jgi:hypothetical protein
MHIRVNVNIVYFPFLLKQHIPFVYLASGESEEERRDF